jgi:hypothetical protein
METDDGSLSFLKIEPDKNSRHFSLENLKMADLTKALSVYLTNKEDLN